MEQKHNVSRETSASSYPVCPICSEQSYTKLFDVLDHSVTREVFNILECQKCSFKLTHPIPENIEKYYASEAYISHSKTKKGAINRLYHLAQTFNLRYKFAKVRSHTMGKIWIDYGSGAGDFLKYCAGRGLSVSGVEPHVKSRQACLAQGFMVITPEEYFAHEQKVDSITMWHVLEHIPNLTEVLSKHYRSLTENGILIIAVPNPGSYDALHYKEYWAAWDVPRHLWHFREEQLTSLLSQHNFIHVKTYGMPLDAFYISMLSEKYKQGTLLGALITAAISKLKFWLSSTPDSSQIYIFRKTA